MIDDSSSDDDSVSSTETSTQLKDSGCTLYVGRGFPSYIKEKQIREHFAANGFGAFITEVLVPYDKATGNGKGFGFVTFSSPKAAEDAMSIINGTSLLQKYKVEVQLYKKKPKQRSVKKAAAPNHPASTRNGHSVDTRFGSESFDVYVGSHLPNHIKNDHIREHFKFYEASITSAMVMRDPQTKKTKGYAIVTFSSLDAARDAVQKLNKSLLHGKFCLHLEEDKKRSDLGVPMVNEPSRQTPTKDTSAHIEIRNLHSCVNEDSLLTLFSDIQHKSCRINSDENTAVLELFSIDDARRAVGNLDGINFLGQVIKVSHWKPPGPRRQRGSKPNIGKEEIAEVRNNVTIVCNK